MESAKRPEDVVTIDVHSAKILLSSTHRYLDVRTTEEFNKSHISNALNVPYMFITQEGRVKNPEFISQVAEIIKKEDRIIVGCNSGGRSIRACRDLVSAGYDEVSNMEGGYSAWVDAGFASPQLLKTSCSFRPSSE